MDTKNYGTARVIKALMEAVDKFDEAKAGAQFAKDEKLFFQICTRQDNLLDFIATLLRKE